MKVVTIDDLMSVCGYATSETDANNGYGCNHPGQEEYEMLWKDEDGFTHRGYENDEAKPKTKQGKCYSFSCPLAESCLSLSCLKEHDKDLYNQVLEENRGMSLQELESELDAYQYVIVIDKEIEKTL